MHDPYFMEMLSLRQSIDHSMLILRQQYGQANVFSSQSISNIVPVRVMCDASQGDNPTYWTKVIKSRTIEIQTSI